jgi:hypothetical protein
MNSLGENATVEQVLLLPVSGKIYLLDKSYPEAR